MLFSGETGDVGWLAISQDCVLKSQAICIGNSLISGERHRLSGSRKHVRLARSPALIEAGDAGIEDLIPLGRHCFQGKTHRAEVSARNSGDTAT